MVLQALKDFCKAFGLKVNLEKSRVMCSKNISSRRWENFTSISSIRFANDLGKYLGFPLFQDRVSRSTFSDLLGKIQTRLTSWKGKLLNRAGIICLAKSVIVSLLIHTMLAH